MSKKCAKCEKTVYPAEELKCLDKSWHKPCFRCWECNMALTLTNYKGYDKLPYCKAHCPQPSATVVADTPEMRRNAAITKLNSQSNYHADYLKNMKGSRPSEGDAEDYDQGGSSYTRPMREYDGGQSDAPTSYMPPPSGGGGGMAPPPVPQGLVYTALYDYEAQDEDEVGFEENDRIVGCEVVDEGWVMGTVEKTGKRGMIPANYIEQA